MEGKRRWEGGRDGGKEGSEKKEKVGERGPAGPVEGGRERGIEREREVKLFHHFCFPHSAQSY